MQYQYQYRIRNLAEGQDIRGVATPTPRNTQHQHHATRNTQRSSSTQDAARRTQDAGCRTQDAGRSTPKMDYKLDPKQSQEVYFECFGGRLEVKEDFGEYFFLYKPSGAGLGIFFEGSWAVLGYFFDPHFGLAVEVFSANGVTPN